MAKAAAVADEMAALLSRATTDRADNSSTRIIRDKAYVFLKQAVDELRECGQYVFWPDDAHSKGYISRYHKHK